MSVEPAVSASATDQTGNIMVDRPLAAAVSAHRSAHGKVLGPRNILYQ